ncbi:hypothetical protein [Butyrivibrio sp. VCB2001]|uniref:hypothetical protein n=1 Tax=Butyrivibrio sp. VCB2001 TaxID=1280667 RepID=UPI00047DDA2F|nr:hypothetical protein [Butyrivibrio sp. VCB2001]
MRTLNRFIKICFGCTMALLLALSNFGLVSYATEDKESAINFNSVVEVESYSIENGHIEAGKVNDINIKLHNANTYTDANSVIITLTSNSEMIYPTYGNDNQYYIGKLSAGKSSEITVPMIANSVLSGDYIDLTCTIVYESYDKKITNVATMILPTQNISSIFVSSVDVSAHATINGKSLLSIGYVNNSLGNINDAVLTVNGNVSESTKNIELGAIAAGKSYTKDCNVIFTESGKQNISIVLTYTDLNGEVVESNLGTYSVNVGEENESGLVSNTNNEMLNTIGKGIALLAAVVAAIVAFLYIKKR